MLIGAKLKNTFGFTASALQMTGESKVYNQGRFTVTGTSIKTSGHFTTGLGLFILKCAQLAVKTTKVCSISDNNG